MDGSSLQERVVRLERLTRWLSIALTIVLALLGTVAVAGWRQPQTGILRAHALVIVDSVGRERIVVGAPIPEAPGRIAAATGLVVRDTAGAERFGFGLYPNGTMGMGFDAPPGTGDGRNRERINIVADPKGGAAIRFLNRQSGIAGYVLLGSDDNMYVQFHSRTERENLFRRIGVLGGDSTVRTPRD